MLRLNSLFGPKNVLGRAGPHRAPAAERRRDTACLFSREGRVIFFQLVEATHAGKTGETVGGIPFTRGPLAHLLRNRFYIGNVPFKGEILKGEQPAIVDRDLFEAVQAKLSEQVNGHKTARMKSEALLLGRIFDDRGNRMSPSHARKGGVKYRYYLSSALLQGVVGSAGSVRRVPAAGDRSAQSSKSSSSRGAPAPARCGAVGRCRNCGVWWSRGSRASRAARSAGSRPILGCSSTMS